jgi:predicted dinucleotide-binding enzyme
MRIAVVGAGRLGSVLGTRWARSGQDVMFTFSRDSAKLDQLATTAGCFARWSAPAEAARWAEVVVLAVPWRLVDAALAQLGAREGALQGRVLVDCTNPWAPSGPPALAVGHNTSGAEQIAAKLPGTRVVKAFSTIAAHLYGAPDFGSVRPSVFLAADDEDAKQCARTLADLLDLPAIDAGVLASARMIEPLALLLLHVSRALSASGTVEVAAAVLRRPACTAT